MNTIKKIKLLFLTVSSLLIVNSCVQDDDWTTPPANCTDNWVADLSIEELYALVDADEDHIISFETDRIVEGYVVSSDSTGNFFKTLSIQNSLTNPTFALQVEMDRTNLFNNFPLGSKIKINLNGLDAGYDRGMLKIGEIYDINRVGRMAEFKIDQKVVKTCDDIAYATPVVYPNIQAVYDSGVFNTLVTIENVQFIAEELGTTYADAQNQTTVNKTLIDVNGTTIILRNSGYANFAGELLPEGSGNITVVISGYDGNVNGTVSPSEYQLFIRDTDDVQFNEPRFGPLFSDGFDNGLANWTTQSVVGAQIWETRNFGNPAPCAYMSGFASGNQVNEDWLVSNAISAPSTLSNLYLSFETDRGYNGNALEVFYTTNFTGDVTTTTWTSLPATLDTQNDWNTWTNSGNLDVSAAIGGDLYIAFKYTSTTSAAATWELDNVKVFEE
ncbi:DUF5689 domain-containing protein [Moheibacter lacus]|uniref:Choice-of-anchor J domain-containing protein n=1 Tax=Moheibacter lacus TaxID=2745851 RepID=A0A838ZRG1_9FLAO|nr:DUF5689 domain-containing protein [Moheibacter lacus]MBA5629132.1 choice-of-anchor J domain-containing protein [Moheibacter lacus]